MADLRVGSDYDYPVGRLVPLEARGPAWLSFSIGPVIASAAAAGLPAALLALFGQGMSLLIVAGVGGFLLICLTIGLLVFSPERRTGSNLFAGVFGVGHTLLVALLGAAYFIPGGPGYAANLLENVPFLSTLPVLPGTMGALAPLYLLGFVSFSVLAPVAVTIFRYIALSKVDLGPR